MTKEELRTNYINQGWEVQPIADWILVSFVEGKVKYDVNVVSPENRFGTVQVVVVDNEGVNEEATAEGFWKEIATPFRDEVRTFLDTKEVGTVFAVAITNVFEEDLIAEAKAYLTDFSTKNYVIKKRDDVLSFQEIA